MLNLFTHYQLLQVPKSSASTAGYHNDVSIKLAVFGAVTGPLDNVQSRLVLYCDDARLLLVQFTSETDIRPGQYWIPTDPAKGTIISMVLNSTSTSLLALTSQSYLYVIPFSFKSEVAPFSTVLRAIPQEDARVLRCLSLRSPTSLAWWERPHAATKTSIALVGNSFGQLVFVDLSSSIEFKLFTFQFGIESLAIFEELYCQTLLISCTNRMQYQLTLEQFRSNITSPAVHHAARRRSNASTTTIGSSGSAFLMACVMSYPFGISVDDENNNGGISPAAMASVLDSNEIKPQLIFISDDPSPSSTVATSNQTEFLDLFEDSHKMSIHPQRHTRSVFVVKQNKPKYDFTSTSTNSMTLDETGSISDSSDLSATFCSVSLNTDLSLDVHEFRAEDFCTKTIILRESKLFLVSVDETIEEKQQEKRTKVKRNVEPSSPTPSAHQLLKIIDCGHRFFLLIYPSRVALVSKYFSEQRNYHSASSPRSPLLLKKSDSLRSSGGSFRRKNYHYQNSGCGSTGGNNSAVIEDFKVSIDFDNDDEIVSVFLVSTPVSLEPDFTKLAHRDYPLPSAVSSSATNCGGIAIDLDCILRSEKAAIETKLSPKINDLIRIDERFLVITRRRCYAVSSKETSFGEYFHREIIQQLELVDSSSPESTVVDGDVITRAKYLVYCFVFRTTRYPMGPSPHSTTSTHPCQSWQFWLTRSALLLMQQLSASLPLGAEPELTPENLHLFNQIFRLFELARTPRRRVITALTYFRFWSRALFYLRKFFETRVLQELTDEERLFLAHQMLDCLLERRVELTRRRASLKDSEVAAKTKEADQELYTFFRSYRAYYDIGRTLERLIDCGLFEMARFVALIQSEYLLLVQLLLRKFSTNLDSLSKECRSQILDLLTSSRLTYTLILSTRFLPPDSSTSSSPSHSPTSPFYTPLLTGSGTSIRLIESYLDFVLKALPHLSTAELHRLVSVLNPNRFEMQLLLNNVLDVCNQTYLRDLTGSSTASTLSGHVLESYLPIRKRDLLNLYMFVLLLCLRKAHHRKHGTGTRLYDWDFLANMKNCFEGFKTTAVSTVEAEEEDSTFCVSAGTFHSVAFESSRTNEVYVWGKFPFVRLGLDSAPTRHLRTPFRLTFFSALLPRMVIREVVCGHQHTMVATDAGLFTFGSSTFGQLGLGLAVLESKYPMPVERFQAGSGVKAVKIVTGSYHSCAISEDGELFTWGWALHGQLGHGGIEDEPLPKRVDAFDYRTMKIIDVGAGYAHTVVLTNTYDVYVFGENSYSQLGLNMDDAQAPGSGGSKTKYCLPQKLTPTSKLPGRVRLIACGLFHTIALVTTEPGPDTIIAGERLFCWGLDPKTWRVKMRSDRASGGSAGRQDTQLSVYEYAKIREICLEKVAPGRVQKIVAGQSHSIVLTEEGRCYTFGFGREGQLGLGSGVPSSPLVAEPILELEAIVDIAAGASHSLAVNTDGTVWGWGQNADYQLDNSPSILDQGAGVASTPNSSRRNSLLNSLMKRGDDQLMSRLMSLQKNVEWIPIRIHIPLAPTTRARGSSMPEPMQVGTPMRTSLGARNRATMIKQQLMECLIRYRDLLDFRSLLKRFNQFEYPQLSAIVSYFLNDPISTYIYQLAALKQEIQMELASFTDQNIPEPLSTKWLEEIYSLTSFFVNRNPRSTSDELYKLLSGLVRFWAELVIVIEPFQVSGSFTLKNVFSKLYFRDIESPVGSPYFGVNLFRVLQEEDRRDGNFRRKYAFDDQFLLKLLEQTQEAIRNCPAEMVQIQQQLEQLVDVKTKVPRGCPDHQTATANFPLELVWGKILGQFRGGQELTTLKTANLDDSDEIEIHLPSDLEEEEEEDHDQVDGENKENRPMLLYIFKCGHCLTRRQILAKIEEFKGSYYEAITKVLEDAQSELIRELFCPQCQSS